jgi:imidazolonepropionase-like amidohydrolase
VYRAIVEEAKAQGLPVAGHCPERVSAFDASRLGQRSIEHLTGVAVSCSRGEAALRERLTAAFTGEHGYDIDATFPIIETAMAAPDEDKQTALFAAFKKNRTWQVPTLVTQRPLPGPGAPADPRLKYTHWALAQLWERIRAGDKHGKFRESCTAYARTTVRAMHKAGVPLLAGTDAGGASNVNVFPGFSLADELELLVECGLTPADALRTATLNPALYLGEEATAGTVSEGKRADLVLLDADPLAAIGNVRKIAGVMARGRWLPRPELDKLLDGVAESAAKKK